jgi:hypothetical protein
MLGHVSTREAAQALSKRSAAVGRPTRAPIKFEEFVVIWKANVWNTYRYSTRKHHRQILNTTLIPRFGSIPVNEIDRQSIQQFIGEVQGAEKAPRTINHYHKAP